MSVRFAPSPTGYLHVGNARTALINYLYAREHAASFILRLDDTDTERSKDAFAAAIDEDLEWLGIDWDRKERQSARLGEYEEAFGRLRESGHVYPCYETAEELALKRKALLAASKPPIYDRAALDLTAGQRKQLEADGHAPYWRFKLDGRAVEWDDGIHGPLSIDAASLSDPVLIRGDGRPLYLLSSVVDDIQMGVSLIVRGEDHISNTAAQIQMFEAIGARPPIFAHHGLMTGPGGEPLSKRLGSITLRSLRAAGMEPMALASYLARIGTSDAIENRFSVIELLRDFDLSKIAKSPAMFDPAVLAQLNARYLHDMPFASARVRLAGFDLAHIDEDFWNAVQPNLATLAEALEWWHIVHEPIEPAIDDQDFTARAAALLPQGRWSAETWGEWTKAVTAATGASGKALYRPLRRALTGRDQGPEMKRLLPLIDPDRAAARLRGETA